MRAINEEQMEPKFADKSWNPAVEQTIWKKWEDNSIYQFSIIEQKHAFVIDSPPPYPSGRPWHIESRSSLRPNRYDRQACQNDGVTMSFFQ